MKNSCWKLFAIFASISALIMGVIVASPASAKPPWDPPRPSGVVQPDKPFLKLPFKQSISDKLKVTQGWGEEATEASLIGPGNHASIDFEGYPYGAPILAAADGWAYYSYQRIIQPVNYKDPLSGRQVNYIDVGAGIMVEIVHDARANGVPGKPRWVSQYIHLSKVAPGIPLARNDQGQAAEENGIVVVPGGEEITNYYPTGVMQPEAKLVKLGKRVKQGDVIGYNGDTGIGANWYDNWNGTTVEPRDRAATPPWDPQGAYKKVSEKWAAQLHFNVYAGRGADGLQGQQNRIDSFDLYAESDLGILPGHRYDNPYMKGRKVFAGPVSSKTAFERRGIRLLFAG